MAGLAVFTLAVTNWVIHDWICKPSQFQLFPKTIRHPITKRHYIKALQHATINKNTVWHRWLSSSELEAPIKCELTRTRANAELPQRHSGNLEGYVKNFWQNLEQFEERVYLQAHARWRRVPPSDFILWLTLEITKELQTVKTWFYERLPINALKLFKYQKALHHNKDGHAPVICWPWIYIYIKLGHDLQAVFK